MADTLIAGTTIVENSTKSDGDVPVGGIIPWLKSFTNTPTIPTGWVECSGQTLVDVSSVYNGEVIPDLNGDNRFLRGDSTSGGTGGSETHQHGFPEALSYTPGGAGTLGGDTSVPRQTSATSTLPTYYGVVWIMRIR